MFTNLFKLFNYITKDLRKVLPTNANLASIEKGVVPLFSHIEINLLALESLLNPLLSNTIFLSLSNFLTSFIKSLEFVHLLLIQNHLFRYFQLIHHYFCNLLPYFFTTIYRIHNRLLHQYLRMLTSSHNPLQANNNLSGKFNLQITPMHIHSQQHHGIDKNSRYHIHYLNRKQ